MFTKSKHAGQKVVNLEKIPFSSKPNSFTIRVGINCKNWDHFTCLIFGKYLGAFFPKNNHCRADYSAVINNLTNKEYRLLHWRRRKETFFLYFGYSWLIGIIGSILLMELIQNTYEEDDGDSTRYQFSELSIRIQGVYTQFSDILFCYVLLIFIWITLYNVFFP